MITDLILDEFLTSIGDTPTSNLDLRIAAKESTDVNDWRLEAVFTSTYFSTIERYVRF